MKGTPAVLRRFLHGTRLSITCVIIFHGLPPVDKRMPRFVLTTHMTERAVAQWLALWC